MAHTLDSVIKIALVGKPAGGKGTLVTGLKKILSFSDSQGRDYTDGHPTHTEIASELPMGVIFRNHIHNKTGLGTAVLPYTSKRELVPDVYVNQVAQDAFDAFDGNHRLIFMDGYPRNVAQYDFVKEHGYITMAVIIDAPDDVCINRSLTRFIHPTTQDPYNSSNDSVIVTEWKEITFREANYRIPIRAELIDGTQLTKRKDDLDIDIVLKGIDNYHNHTAPLVDVLYSGLANTQCGVNADGIHVVKINGDQPAEKIVQQFMNYFIGQVLVP